MECLEWIQLGATLITSLAMVVSVYLASKSLTERRGEIAPYFSFIDFHCKTNLPNNLPEEETSSVAFLGVHEFIARLQNVGKIPATEVFSVFALLRKDSFEPCLFHGESVATKCEVTDVPAGKDLILNCPYTFSVIYSEEDSIGLGNPCWLSIYISYKIKSSRKPRVQLFVRDWDGTTLSGDAIPIKQINNERVIARCRGIMKKLAQVNI